MDPTCPGCEEALEYINYSQRTEGWESGTQYLPTSTGERDCHDSETTDFGEFEFSCPACGHQFDSEEIEIINALQITEHPPETSPRNVRNIFNNHVNYFSEYDTPIGPRTGEVPVDCPHCKHSYIDLLAQEMICPSCNKEWTPDEEIPDIKINIIQTQETTQQQNRTYTVAELIDRQ